MELHTIRTLYDKWEYKYNEKSNRINQLKEKIKNTTDLEHIDQYEYEINLLSTQANQINAILVDLGLMVYVEEQSN